jgi:hypothetical protein
MLSGYRQKNPLAYYTPPYAVTMYLTFMNIRAKVSHGRDKKNFGIYTAEEFKRSGANGEKRILIS